MFFSSKLHRNSTPKSKIIWGLIIAWSIITYDRNGKTTHITGPLCRKSTVSPGNFLHQGPAIQSFHTVFVVSLIKPLTKQSSSWWNERPYTLMWCHSNDDKIQHGNCKVITYNKSYFMSWIFYQFTSTCSMLTHWSLGDLDLDPDFKNPISILFYQLALQIFWWSCHQMNAMGPYCR